MDIKASIMSKDFCDLQKPESNGAPLKLACGIVLFFLMLSFDFMNYLIFSKVLLTRLIAIF